MIKIKPEERYKQSENILNLAFMMLGTTTGISLQDIQDKFNVGRRTAERMRNSILNIFSNQAEEVETDERIKRWRITSSYNLQKTINFNANELAVIESAINILKKENRLDEAKTLSNINNKLKTMNDKNKKRSVAPDLDALIESEGLVTRAGPKQEISTKFKEIIRESIKACRKIKILYKSKNKSRVTWRTVHPYGFVYGNKHYLLAYSEKANKYHYYMLSEISDISLLKEIFERNQYFSIPEYLKNSFAVFQEEQIDVKLKFDKRVASDIEKFMFHKTQKIKKQQDGSVIVEFTAGGKLEMCWHFFTWGDTLEILEPKELVDEYKEMLNSVIDIY